MRLPHLGHTPNRFPSSMNFQIGAVHGLECRISQMISAVNDEPEANIVGLKAERHAIEQGMKLRALPGLIFPRKSDQKSSEPGRRVGRPIKTRNSHTKPMRAGCFRSRR